MGLFIGAGLLTLVQLVEYIIDEMLALCGIKRDNERDEECVFCGCQTPSHRRKSMTVMARGNLGPTNKFLMDNASL